MITKILLFGATGAAKSTLCAMICHFFHEAPGYSAHLNSIDNRDSAKLIVEWRKRLLHKRFPEKTSTVTFAAIDIGFTHRSREEQAALRFLEIAGENVIRLSPIHDEHADVDRELETWAREADIILLVGSVHPAEDDRFRMQTFLEYINYNGMTQPTALIITEWDKLPPPPLSVGKVAIQVYPEATRRLRDMPSSEVFSFSVGRVSETGSEAVIEDLSFGAGTERIVNWLLQCMRQRFAQ